MFAKSTVFILGAGASWHYGFPLGETLVQRVADEAEVLASFHQQFCERPQLLTRYAASMPGDERDKHKAAASKCRLLAERLIQLNPPVIDYFLGQSPTLIEVGRMLIALAILRSEANFRTTRSNTNRTSSTLPFRTNDDWCRFITYQIAVGCRRADDIFENDVTFVTFNYDTSLENAIMDGLNSIETFNGEPTKKFFENNRVIHVYGKAGDSKIPTVSWVPPPRHDSPMDHLEAYVRLIDLAYNASQDIMTVAPDQKPQNAAQIQSAKDALARAKRVYLLGYGFDPNNSGLLELGKHLADINKNLERVYYTNKGDSNQVNKRASRIFFGNEHEISSHSLSVVGRYERSTRDTYQALSLDFDFA